jgi:hypothetical protein
MCPSVSYVVNEWLLVESKWHMKLSFITFLQLTSGA